MRYLLLAALIPSIVAPVVTKTVLPLAFHNKLSYIGFVERADGLWSGFNQSDPSLLTNCPQFFNVTGNFSFVLRAEPFICSNLYLEHHSHLQGEQFTWVPTQRLFDALRDNRRLVKLGRNRSILLDSQLFNALRTTVSMERMAQLLPSYGGVCMVDVCCRRKKIA